jgi:hypothetical protein
LQDPPKFTQIWNFGLKIYHLAAHHSDGDAVLKETTNLRHNKNMLSPVQIGI